MIGSTIVFFQYDSAVIHKFTWDMRYIDPLVSMEQLESLIALSSVLSFSWIYFSISEVKKDVVDGSSVIALLSFEMHAKRCSIISLFEVKIFTGNQAFSSLTIPIYACYYVVLSLS